MTASLLSIAALWVACGVASAGICYADFDDRFPILRSDPTRHGELIGRAMFAFMFGPISLIVLLLDTGFARHGWRLRPGPPVD